MLANILKCTRHPYTSNKELCLKCQQCPGWETLLHHGLPTKLLFICLKTQLVPLTGQKTNSLDFSAGISENIYYIY